MVGISSIGIYVPRSRLDRALVAKAWGKKQPAGEKAVAHFDEDALTMAVEAGHRCLADFDPSAFDGLFFASTSAPYREKQVASVVATACDLPREIVTADFSGSVRAGLTALTAALRTVASGGAKRILVVASDCRPAEPDGDLEGLFGDGAVAVVVDAKARLAAFEGAAAVAEEFTFQWRTDAGDAVQAQDQRFSLTHGYLRDLGEVIGRVLNEHGVGNEQLAALAVGSPDARAAQDLAKAVGIDAKTQLVPSLIAQIGVLGSPDPLLLLGAALRAGSVQTSPARLTWRVWNNRSMERKLSMLPGVSSMWRRTSCKEVEGPALAADDTSLRAHIGTAAPAQTSNITHAA
mgnify:CR=1 FL=1